MLFDRLYIALMFVTILAIGGLAEFARLASQHNGDAVEAASRRTADVLRVATALDDDYVGLLSQPGASGGGRRRGSPGLAQSFDLLLAVLSPDATAGGGSLADSMRRERDGYVRQARSVVSVLGHGDRRRAASMVSRAVQPRYEALRTLLVAESNVAVAATERATRDDDLTDAWLERLIGLATALGLALMGGFAMILRRYRRVAAKATRAQVDALHQAALTDNLTLLGNHRAFSDDFAREIARAKRNRHPLALALIDVDDFKAVNDSHGHSHGDEVLARVGESLRSLRAEDRSYRVGGDEFALLLVETGPADAHAVLTRLKRETQDALAGVTLSIGYANLTLEQLDREPYELADTALYEAKRRGRDAIVCFDQIADGAAIFSPRKAEAVRRLIHERLLDIAFQPIWDIAGAYPLAFEALARPATELGLSGPQEAFDVAERIRQVYDLDMVCIAKTLEAAAVLPSGSTVFLNVAPASLSHPGFDPRAFVAAVRAAGLHPDHVVVELTERRIENAGLIVKRAQALRALGVRMALDDTGSGHAGLEILSKLSVDFVKIDRALLVQAAHDRTARGVLAGIIAIARETGSYLIAEGVENVALLEFACAAHGVRDLAFQGIRGAQGYLLGRPEVGAVNLRSLAEHGAYLKAHREGPSLVSGPQAA